MRIDRFDLLAFGSFTGKSIDLSEGTAGLHLIYGDNEAGKSTSLRALIALLFGIDPRTNDNYLHSSPQLRVGGKLRLLSGKEIEFIRRKGNKGTLLEYGTDKAIDDSFLAPFLPGGINENLFTKLYGIDHTRLISGGQELLSQSGDLGQALFSAAVGTSSLRVILSGLQNEADELYKPRASTKPVNQAITSFKESLAQIKSSILPVAEWQRLQKELSDILLAIQKVEDDLSEKNKAKSRLDRLSRVKGALAERRGTLSRIGELGEVLLLPEDFDEKRKTANANLQSAIEAKARAESKLSRLNIEVSTLSLRNELLENEETIIAIFKELGAVETAIEDRPQQDGKRRLLRNEAEQLLKSVDSNLGLIDADRLRPLTNNKKWISDLVQKHSLLNQKKEKANGIVREVEDEQAKIKQELGKQTQSSFDLIELKAVVASARKAGNLEQRLVDLLKRVSGEKAACESEFSRLGKFSGTINKLSIISMPVSETLDIFEKQFDELTTKIKDDSRKHNEIEEEKKQAELDLKALMLTNNVPTILELNKARLERNTGWNLIKRKYIEENSVEKEIYEFTADSDLPTIYEQKVDLADHVSDQLRLAADQVLKRADLEAKIENFQARSCNIAAEVKKTNENTEILQSEWNVIWEQLGVTPGSPREMKQWLLRVEKLLANIQVAKTDNHDAKQLDSDCKAVRETVSQQIAKFDSSIDLAGKSLEAMISLCEQRIELEENTIARKRQLTQSLNDTEIRIKRVQEELASIESERSSWVREWRQAIDGLGLKPDVHPEHAMEAFEQLLKFFDRFDKSEELRKRIYGIDQVVEKYEEKVLNFIHGIGYKKDDQKVSTIVARLNRELNEAREVRASFTKIKLQEKEISEEIEEAGITIRTAQDQITTLIQQAGVEKVDELEIAGEKSRNKRQLQNLVATVEQELTRNGDGLSIEELEQEAQNSDVDAIEGLLEKVSSELKELQDTRDVLRDQRQTLQNEIKTKDGNAKAAHASEEAEQQLTNIVSGVEQYLRLKIASLILEKRIEDYRKKNQAPVLAKAGELFSKLTLGSYTSLRDELDKSGKLILLGVRPNNVEVTVDGMSEGTLDQLYLSLRLATLEQHLSKGEPMPFIVDDILIGFDDNRTKVCLEILAELAQSTQVLLFTHHRRVVELASALNTNAGIFNHELSC